MSGEGHSSAGRILALATRHDRALFWEKARQSSYLCATLRQNIVSYWKNIGGTGFICP